MKNETVEVSEIFAGLRQEYPGGALSQLWVDITDQALKDEVFKEKLVERLGLSADKREYNLSAATLRKIHPGINEAAIPLVLKYAPKYGIVTKKNMAAFVATCVTESKFFSVKRESFAYSAKRLVEVFPKFRIPSLAFAQSLVNKGQVAIANHLYGDRGGNRPGTNDGWDYRGGGGIQNTFRDNYYKLQVLTGIKFGDNPKLIEDLENSVIAAMAFWQERGLNNMAEKINTYSNGYTLNTLNSKGVETKDYKMNYGARIVRETVNGGLNGYNEFCQHLEDALRYL